MRLSQLFLHAADETFRADDGALVQAAHDDFVCIAGFDLKLNLAAINREDLRAAMDCLADGRRRKMANVNFKTHGTFVGIKVWREQMARGAFEELDDVRRGDDGGHAVASKFHGVFHIRRDGQFADFTNSGTRFHSKQNCHRGAEFAEKIFHSVFFESLWQMINGNLLRQQVSDE